MSKHLPRRSGPFQLMRMLLIAVSVSVSLQLHAATAASDYSSDSSPNGLFAQLQDSRPETAFTVTNNGDAGPGTLRQAITDANATPGADAINITVTGSINLDSELPMVSAPVSINGPGANLLTIRRNSGGDYRILGFSAGQTSSLSGVTVSNGNSLTDGGGIHNAGTLTVTTCAISGNIAAGLGGGIANAGTLTVTASTISGNTTRLTSSGGGIANTSMLTIRSSTISGNSALESNAAGGIYSTGGEVSIVNSTITSNRSSTTGSGGVRAANGAAVTLKNTIIAANTTGVADVGSDAGSSFISNGFNLIGNRGAIIFNGISDQAGTAAAVLNPGLSSLLAYDGGPTQVHTLFPNSPARDKGNNGGSGDTVDQRGQPRTVDLPAIADALGGDSTDIGAYETQLIRFVTSPASSFVGEPFGFTIRAVDITNNTVPTFADTVRFSSTSGGTLPADYTFTPTDAGVHTFTATLDTQGTQTVTANAIGASVTGTFNVSVRSREPAVVVVTNTSDDGPGSLRQAIRDVGFGGTISFSSLFSQPQIITLTTGELAVGNMNIVGPGADRLTISGNNSSSVVGVYSSVPVQLSGMTITEGHGPGIHMPFGGRLTLDGMVVYGNTGGSPGSGLYGFASDLTVSNSTFYGNSPSAIYNNESSLTITNSTISGNLGYGITSLGSLTVANCTITNNALGGVLFFSGATIGSSIIAGNINNTNQPDIINSGGSFTPPLISNGYNLVGNRGALVFNGPGDQAGTATGVLNPQLGPLQINGGTTPTHLPQSGSRAIDAGNSSGLTNDQRGMGFLRVVDLLRANAPGGNGTDIGAVELQAEPPPTTAGIFGNLRRPSGTALANTRVYLVDQQGQMRTVTSSSFGEFSFTGLPVGQTYSIGVSSKRYRFGTMSLFLDANIGGVNMVGLE